MVTTRSSRGSLKSSPASATKSSRKSPGKTNSKVAGKTSAKGSSKRPAASQAAPPAQRGRPTKTKKAKQQKTIEETMNGIEDDNDVSEQINGDADSEEQANGDAKDGAAELTEVAENEEQENKEGEDADSNKAKQKGVQDGEKNALDKVKADEDEVKKDVEKEQEEKSETLASNNKSVVEDKERAASIPSSILEKGIIYVFSRSRVGVKQPETIEDVARSFIVLRPIPLGAKLGEGPLEDSGNARILALPKKLLPTDTNEKFMVYINQSKLEAKEIREHFSKRVYATKTAGTSISFASNPIVEGVYAIISTGRESHLAYRITEPEVMGPMQQGHGIYQKGSFVCSVKNPKAPGPANATLDKQAEYPAHIQEKFRGLRWMPVVPEILDYQNTQMLLIGEAFDEFGHAIEEQSKDTQDDSKEKPIEELKKLEEEDHDRVKHLKQDDPVLADLALSSKVWTSIKADWKELPCSEEQ